VSDWIDRLGADPRAVLFVIGELGGRAVGFVQVTEIDTISGHRRLGIAIAPAHQGVGHGGEALVLLARYLRQVFGLRKLVLEVLAENARAVALYERVGFTHAGVLKQHFREGQDFFDVAVMEWMLPQ
jgi:RimJ/RimL family protein N-acetyltransferase